MNDKHETPTHLFATIGSLTERGGRVTSATSGVTLAGLEVARVGDVVTYDDGSEAAIIDGAGDTHSDGKPFALVGSQLSNGDRIVETLRTSWGLHVPDGQRIPGLFDPTYVPPPAPLVYRLAVRGATTAHGGVLREPSGTWEVAEQIGKAGAIGDLIHYRDGSTARIVSGLGLTSCPDFAPLAFVGSELDNGDTITDSPERQGMASSAVFSVVARSPLSD
ncbi:hypothetical protein FCJ61_11975 [Burkholderia metallica]|uniref:PAAR domain-containing protein n=1 Tax=Burkholderia metallica TaxID=488729 RepID=UPI00157AFE4B|nr:PAAR domain-containing protein [Burkholderia metallica]NTZ83699.1 hypothetical protein [Burkholderia metallica]